MAGTVVADKWQNGDGTENYKCRAWVNFNGTGTVSIRASGNVSSITDNGTGNYTVNFTNAMSDSNYGITFSAIQYDDAYAVTSGAVKFGTTPTSSNVRTAFKYANGTYVDVAYCYAQVIR